MTTNNTHCPHGISFVDDCEQCEEALHRYPIARNQREYCAQIRRIVQGGQGRSASSVRASGVWAGVAILALSAGTVVWMLLRWAGWVPW